MLARACGRGGAKHDQNTGTLGFDDLRVSCHGERTEPRAGAQVNGVSHDNAGPASGIASIRTHVKWKVQETLADMDKGSGAAAITSPTTPQVIGLDKAVAARVARESNEFAKKLESDHKGRFGTFAMLPFPHVDECLKEIAYAFDTLKVDGIGCMTSYGDKWLGYAEFEPVWEELSRRKAIVYTHPTAANCCVNLVRGIDDAYLEFGTDTTRSIFSLIFSGSSQKHK